jgi:CHAT domain-containing protein/Flp pilus assembly protein TadD
MRTQHFIFILSLLISFVTGVLLMGFQLPEDKNGLQKRIESLKSTENLDSLIYYQDLLVEVLEKEENQEELETAGQAFLEVVLASNTLSKDQKWALLEKTRISKAWNYAYKTQLYLEHDVFSDNEIDSAYFYLSLLENAPNHKTALIYAYGIWAKEATEGVQDLRTATDYLQKAEYLLNSKADSVQLYEAKVIVYTATGDFDKALITAEKMLSAQLTNSYRDSIKIAFVYNKLGAIYYEQKNYNQAKNYYVEAINFMAERTTYQRMQAKLWYQLASCYYKLKNRPLETVLYLRKVFSLTPINSKKSVLESTDVYLDACNMMALEFLEEKQLDSALVYVEKAQAIGASYKEKETWSIKGQIYLQKKSFKEAESALLRGVNGLGPKTKSLETATRWVALGDYYQVQKKYNQAQKAYNSALWATSSEKEEKGFPSINSLFSKEQALQILTEKVAAMLTLYERSKYSVSLTEIYNQAEYNLEVFQLLKSTVDLSLDFSETTLIVYEQLIEVCELLYKRKQENQYVKQAFYLAEACKNAFLQMMLEEPNARQFGNVPTAIIQKIKTLQERMLWCQQGYWEAQVFEGKASLLDWYKQQMANLQVSLTMAKQSLQENYAKYYQFKYDTKIATLDSLQQALNDSTVLVQYLEGQKSIYQFIIRKDTLAVRKIFWRTYKSTVLKYYKHFTDSKLQQHLQSGGYKDFCITAYELYYKLMHHELLSKGKRIVIIPDGLLNYIPFETLLTNVPVENVHTINFPSLAYLLKQKQITYNYSSSLWLSEIGSFKTPVNNEILGMAATYAAEKVVPSRVPKIQKLRTDLIVREGVRSEMDSLSKKYAGDFYTDRYATESYFKDYASNYGILHLGVYGNIDPDFPEYSSLVFAEDDNEEEDNILTINEIKQLNLNASMVVLNNCQTGYGPYQRGEGMINLGRSFIYAGSPSVILSLWEQDVTYSAIVMDYFYENLKQKVDKDVALRQAKLKYLKNTSGLEAHPAYWAGYVVLGNYQAIEVSEPVTYIWWFLIPIMFLGFLGWWSLQALRQRR